MAHLRSSTMKFSHLGQLLAADAPIVQLMDDLGEALHQNPDSLFLGGGNPAEVPAAQALFRTHLLAIAEAVPHSRLGVYQSPQGDEAARRALADYLRGECGWKLDCDHITLISGSQTAFFILFNLFCDADHRALLPLVPEYLGYAAQVLAKDAFIPIAPVIETTAAHRFKYHVDFAAFTGCSNVNMLCLSSPANPSGNVLSGREVERLWAQAVSWEVPLVLDYAYGLPFPGLVYRNEPPFWRPGTVAVLSLSKLGLPGVRGAAVIAEPALAAAAARANTIVSLASGNLAAHLLTRLLASGDMAKLSRELLPAFYRTRREWLLGLLERHLAPFDYALHEPEGAFFVWLWLRDLPITARELYERLKARSVIVMPGEAFFFGLAQSSSHARQCIRLTYCQPPEVLEAAVVCLAEVLADVLAERPVESR